MRKAIFFMCVASFSAFSCKKAVDTSTTAQFIGEWNGTGCNPEADKWTQKAPNYATGRSGGVAFSVNNNLYVGGGYGKKDFWGYNTSSNTWARLADIPGTIKARDFATAFAVNDIGYVFGGGDSTLSLVYKDLWKFDWSTNLWGAAATMPGVARQGAFSFVINETAYVGGGRDASGAELKDFWAYSQAGNNWTQKADLPATVANTYAFSANNFGFVTCGTHAGAEDTSTYMYDPSTNTWSRQKAFKGHARQGGTAFSIGNTGYIGLGSATGGLYFNDFYTYSTITNEWTRLGDYPGGYVEYPVSAVAAGKAYVGMGIQGATRFRDWYQYIPASASTKFNISAGSNSFSLFVTFSIAQDSCAIDVTLPGTVSTNSGKDIFAIATQTVTDRCGNNYAISGSGSIVNDEITITTVTSTSNGTTACTFKGKK